MPPPHAAKIDDIEMPTPYGYAPAPGLRLTASIDFALRNIRALVALWESRRGTRHGLPGFAQFDALELRPWADNLMVLDVEPTLFGGRSYRYRTVGPSAAAVEGGNFCGLYLSDALSRVQAVPRLQLYDLALDARTSMEVHRRIEGAEAAGPAAQWDAVALPLARNGQDADHLMVLTYVEALG